MYYINDDENKCLNKKIDYTIKKLPCFMGLTGDLLFWASINTIFLTVVKGFSIVQISSLTAIANLISILLYSFSFKIIKKIGNINSIRLGTLLLFLSALLITFCHSYVFILFGNILYDSAFLFKNMDNVILRKNLKYRNRENDYMKIQSKSSFIYSFLTMIIAFTSGFLFNINNYLPMILCVIFCFLNLINSNFLYEYKGEIENVQKEQIKNKLKITRIIFLIFLLYATLYATIDLGQSNSKLLLQYNLSSFLDISKVSIILSIIIAISRIVRVVSNYVFTKRCKKDNKNLLYKIGYTLIISFFLIILGSVINLKYISVISMSLGFFIFLGVRDIFDNYMKILLLNNCDEKYHEQAIIYLTVSRKIGKFLISALITLLLLKFGIIYIMIILFAISIFNISIIRKLYKLVLSNKA